MRYDAEQLLSLLPAVYRIRDADRGELRALLDVLAQQIGALEEDLEQLYDDQFVDTAAPWVVPYIGDLLDVTPLYDGGPDADAQMRAVFPDLTGPRFVPRVAQRARADVAKTIFYRKRKATRDMLETLAADVTGWPARVVEFFELLRWTQFIRNHLRLFNKGCPDLRDADALERLNGPFDTIPHAVDVRPISQLTGWYETRNIGFFLWRLRSQFLGNAQARHEGTFHYRANRLGLDAPLFMRAKRGESGGLGELHAPAPIRRRFFNDDILRFRNTTEPASAIYGIPVDPSPDLRRSLTISVDGVVIPPQKICPAKLDPWRQPAGDFVSVDVRNGRIALGAAFTNPADVRVSFHYGFAADLGGGTYPRGAWLLKRIPPITVFVVQKGTAVPTLKKALDDWGTAGRPNAIIVVTGNETYDEPDELVLDPPANRFLVIEAPDGAFPHVIARKPIRLECGDSKASVTLSGLLVEGNVHVTALAGRLRLLHTTLASSGTAIDTGVWTKADTLRIEAAFSIILGAIRIPPNGRGISLYDSILDGGTGDAITGTKVKESASPLHAERTTIFGDVFVRELPLASESIFAGKLDVVRRQQGCARFSFIRYGSRTPRRYRCQPELEIRTRIEAEEKRLARKLTNAETKAIVDAVTPFLVPSFTSTRFGDPGYAQLHLAAPRQITRGAEDGSEMGVLCHLKQPQRENNLRTRLGEYLPFGLEPGIIYVT